MAIAFDSSVNVADFGSSSSHSWAHTCASGAILFVITRGGNGEGNRISGVTYGGVAMTNIASATDPHDSDYVVSLWILANPASGSNNVTVSMSPNGTLKAGSASYTGAAHANQPDASNTNTTTGQTSITTSVTTVKDKCWTILACSTNMANSSPGSGSHGRIDNDSALKIYDSNGEKTPAGSTSMTVTGQNSGDAATVMASFSPFIVNNVDDSFGYFEV